MHGAGSGRAMGRESGVSILWKMSKDTCESAELVTKQHISGGGHAGFLPVGDATVGIGIAFFRLIRSQIYSFNQFDIEIINSDLIWGVRVFFFFLPPMPAVHFFL